MLKALYQSVVRPHTFLENPKGLTLVPYGWVFIVVRWVGYSVIFLFRDYQGVWKPFAPLPFGLDVDTYAFLQQHFSVVFGIFLMVAISVALSAYLRLIKKGLPTTEILNILGVTFFLPWVLVQIVDFVVLYTVGWVDFVVIPVHTVVLVWESVSATEIISGIKTLKLSEKVMSVTVILVVWIVICGMLWR